jgi:dihydrofolate reductase
MSRIVVSQFVSVDGVIEDPVGMEELGRGDWTRASSGPEGGKYKVDEIMDAAAMLLGRKTYEGYAAAWPGRDGEYAGKLNGMPKYVVSSTLQDPEWNNSTVLGGDVGDAVAKLKQDVDGTILVAGSAQLAQALVERDLVDEIRLMVFPVVLGTGKRLFGETSDKKPLRLAESRTVGTDGVTILTYEPVTS